MRDLKRWNALLPAWRQLGDAGFEVFTPMQEVLVSVKGAARRVSRPYIQDLLFVHSTRDRLDPEVAKTPTLQYRYAKGLGYKTPMIVPDRQMDNFVKAVTAVSTPVYICPSEVTESMVGSSVRVIGGPLEGCDGRLLSVQGTRRKRLFVTIPNLVAASVEVEPDYLQIMK